MAFYSRSVFNVLCIAALLCLYKAVASDDDYLKMREGEAEDVIYNSCYPRLLSTIAGIKIRYFKKAA
jgi:hypothetical protein